MTELRVRNEKIRQERARAVRVMDKLREFIA